MQIDTLKIKYLKNDSILKNGDNSVIIIEKNGKEPSFYESPLVSLLIVPLVIIIISALITKFLNKKRAKIEYDKINEEIKSIKSSFQPIVLSTIQKTQDFLLNEKVNVLKNLVDINGNLLKVEQNYMNGQPFIGDTYEYYNSIYQKFGSRILNEFQSNISNKRYYFNQKIIDDILAISNILNSISDEKKRLESIDSINMFEAPDGFQEKMEKTSDIFDTLIEKIRTDLYLNSTFSHDFIEKYQFENKN